MLGRRVRDPARLAERAWSDDLTVPEPAGAFAIARSEVLGRIRDAAARANRDPGGVEVVAISKTVTAERIREAAAAGFHSFGENRVQERQAKAGELEDLAGTATWHLVGPLQSNKARKAIELFDVIETVDSLELAERLDRIAGEVRPEAPLRVLLQANVDDDPAKSGFEVPDLERDLEAILGLRNLAVDGLMTVGRQVTPPQAARPTFAALRRLAERLRERDSRLGPALSMGMTEDYPVAVEEGATIVRIGRAIFGDRPHAG
jgi:PLP dependent protein